MRINLNNKHIIYILLKVHTAILFIERIYGFCLCLHEYLENKNSAYSEEKKYTGLLPFPFKCILAIGVSYLTFSFLFLLVSKIALKFFGVRFNIGIVHPLTAALVSILYFIIVAKLVKLNFLDKYVIFWLVPPFSCCSLAAINGLCFIILHTTEPMYLLYFFINLSIALHIVAFFMYKPIFFKFFDYLYTILAVFSLIGSIASPDYWNTRFEIKTTKTQVSVNILETTKQFEKMTILMYPPSVCIDQKCLDLETILNTAKSIKSPQSSNVVANISHAVFEKLILPPTMLALFCLLKNSNKILVSLSDKYEIDFSDFQPISTGEIIASFVKILCCLAFAFKITVISAERYGFPQVKLFDDLHL